MDNNELTRQFLRGRLIESNYELQWRENSAKPWIKVLSGGLEDVSLEFKRLLDQPWTLECYRIIQNVPDVRVINIQEVIAIC